MAKFDKKIRAHELRRNGKSVSSIAETLGVAKSTVSVWCRDLKLTKLQKETLKRNQIAGGHKGRMIGAQINRQKKLDNITKQERAARTLVGTLSKRDQLMLGIGLYWGEGAKSDGDPASVINSDPEIILMMRNWFENMGVRRTDFRPYIFISEMHRPREKQVVSFWSHYLGIPKAQFNNVTFLKGRPKKVYENHDSYYGVLALRIRKSSTLKYKILGLIKACKLQNSRKK